MQGAVGVCGWEGNTRLKPKGTRANLSSSPGPEAAMTAWNLGSSSPCTAMGSRKQVLHIINALGRGILPHISSIRKMGNKSWLSLNISSLNTFHNMVNYKTVVFNSLSVLSILSSVASLMFKTFSLQREKRCRVYPNAKQTVILQTGSSVQYYGPDR